MPLVSVPAIFDGQQVRLLETAPVRGPYRVLVTFVEPAHDRVEIGSHPRGLKELKGIWQGIELSFEDIQAVEYKISEDAL